MHTNIYIYHIIYIYIIIIIIIISIKPWLTKLFAEEKTAESLRKPCRKRDLSGGLGGWDVI